MNRKLDYGSPVAASIYCSPHPAALQIDPPPGSGSPASRILRTDTFSRQDWANGFTAGSSPSSTLKYIRCRHTLAPDATVASAAPAAQDTRRPARQRRALLRHFVSDRCVSPAFVHRLVRELGAASLLETFHLRDLPPEQALTFLLRCHKGRFYRNRYPTLSLVQGGES